MHMIEKTKPTDLQAAINTIREAVGSAQNGLPEEVFLLVSSLTPLINVDLLIKDEAGRSLLTWRHDKFYGPGWHIPGGIIRFKESAFQRIAAVAKRELGARVEFDPDPIQTTEITHPDRDVRGHFISLLYACRLQSPLDPARVFDPNAPHNGDWQWHDDIPEKLIPQHKIYRQVLASTWRSSK